MIILLTASSMVTMLSLRSQFIPEVMSKLKQDLTKVLAFYVS